MPRATPRIAPAGLAIAKMFDDASRYDEAFAAATEANALLRVAQLAADIRYDHEASRAQDERTMRIFSGASRSRRRPIGAIRPNCRCSSSAFSVPARRSSSRSARAIRRCAAPESCQTSRESSANLQHTTPSPRHWSPQLFRGYADRYLQRLKELEPGARASSTSCRTIFICWASIATMFPRAQIIFCHRDGRDAALSVFFQRFARRGRVLDRPRRRRTTLA